MVENLYPTTTAGTMLKHSRLAARRPLSNGTGIVSSALLSQNYLFRWKFLLPVVKGQGHIADTLAPKTDARNVSFIAEGKTGYICNSAKDNESQT